MKHWLKPAPISIAVALVFLFPLRAARADGTPGIDCGCSQTGPYQAPAIISPAVIQDPIDPSRGTSPNGTYELLVSGGGMDPINLTVKRAATGVVLLTTQLPLNSAWGFSPDDDRFATWYPQSGLISAALYNLAGGSPGSPVWTDSVSAASAAFVFSLNGKHFLAAFASADGFVNLAVRDARSATQRYQASFMVYNPPAEGIDTAGWGFTPDDQDRTFVLAYTSGPTSVEFGMVNLSTGVTAYSDTLVNVTSAFWRFSPCGDVLGIATEQSGPVVNARLRQTRDGTAAGSGDTFPDTSLSSVSLSVTQTHHVATVSGNPVNLAVNTAGQPCAGEVTLTDLTLNPEIVTGGSASTGTVTLSGPAPMGGFGVSLSSSNINVARTPASVTVPQGSTTMNFTITTFAVASDTMVTITATAGSVMRTATLTVTAQRVAVSSLNLNPNQVIGATNSTGTISLNFPAPSDGFPVAVSSSIPELASVPDTVVVAAGQRTATFIVQVTPVETQTTVTISATGGGATRTADLTLIPLAVERVSVDPVCLIGGAGASGTFTLNAAAPSGGLTVSLASAPPGIATVPDTVIVSAGSTSAPFSIQTTAVTVATPVTITATYHGSRSTALQVVPAFTPPRYQVTDLGTFGGRDSMARGINNSGQIVGTAAPPVGGSHAFVWQNGTMTDLGVPPNVLNSEGIAISSNGQVAVYGQINGSLARTFRWMGGPLIDLGSWMFGSAGNIQPKGINASGMIVGTATQLGVFPFHPFIWQSGTFTELPALPGVPPGYTQANAINDAGQVVGISRNQAFIWQAGTISALGPGAANAINGAGHAAGANSPHAVLWRDGTTLDLGLLAGDTRAEAFAVNSLDQVVGVSFNGAVPRAVIASPNWCLSNLNERIPPASGWVLTVARGINDAGQIVGEGTIGGATHAFLLTPGG